MAYDEILAQRIRTCFANRSGVEEKKMFGGLTFMLNGHMCCGVVKDEIMVRVGPDRYEEALARPHARRMDFTGRPMKGMVMVTAEGLAPKDALNAWVDLAAGFISSLPPK